MSILPILSYGAEVLRKPALPVSKIDEETQRLIDDMAETMFAAPGVGLAAPQVGVPKRVVVIRSLEDPEEKDIFVLINPEIIRKDGGELSEEGCLSIPEMRMEVSRPEKVVIKALDRQGKPFEMEGLGLMARILQHEIDHLNGLFYIDRLSPAKRDMIKRKLKKNPRDEGAPYGSYVFPFSAIRPLPGEEDPLGSAEEQSAAGGPRPDVEAGRKSARLPPFPPPSLGLPIPAGSGKRPDRVAPTR
jgi:peptide deformylase